MTRERMSRLLELYSGIGVVSKYVCEDGVEREMCYFYENFDGPTDGIKRAMKQLYPLMDKDVIRSLCFVERHTPNNK